MPRQKQALLRSCLQHHRINKAPITAFCLKVELKSKRCCLQLCHILFCLTAPFFGQLIASLLYTHSFCFYFTFPVKEKTKAQPVWIRTKWDLVVCGKVSNTLSQVKEPIMNHRQAARPRDTGEKPQQFGISDSQPSLAQAKVPLRNLPRRSEVSEHHISPKANALAVQVLSMVK